MNARYGLSALLLASLTGCAGLKLPQDAEEFREYALSSWKQTFVVDRPLAATADVLRKKSQECLNVVVQREHMEYNGPYATQRTRTIQYKPTVRVSAARAELHLQKKYLPRGGSTMQKEPPDGKYLLVYDLYPAGNGKTQVQVFGSSRWDIVHRAIRGWLTGTSVACPDLAPFG